MAKDVDGVGGKGRNHKDAGSAVGVLERRRRRLRQGSKVKENIKQKLKKERLHRSRCR